MSRVKILFEEMGIKSDYTFYDEGKESNEVKAIAKKRGIKTPSKDIALFSCKYAMVDKENLNGCILPRKEVAKALDTLNSKAIDKDHLRKQTVGYWLDAELIKDDIIAYGCFWKSNFPEEYNDIKSRMQEGKVKISFEAWGNREFNENGSYNLNDLEFAGGALLFDTDPAFPDAEVLNFSSINVQQLEFAKVIEDSNKLIKCKECNTAYTLEESIECPKCKRGAMHTKKEMEDEIKKMENEMKDMSDDKEKEKMKIKITEMKKKMNEMHKSIQDNIEESRMNFNFDNQTIARMMYETECPSCNTLGWNDILNIDFENDKVKSRCPNCNGINMYDLTPSVEIIKKGKKPEPIKLSNEKLAGEGLTKNIEANKNSNEKEGTNLMDEFLKKYSKASVEEVVKFLDIELSNIKTSLATKETELSTIKAERESLIKTVEDNKLIVENSKLEAEKIKVELDVFKAAETKKIEDEKVTKVKSRKEDLGEYAKDMSDEDILNDLKFENAKLKKERDEAIKKASTKTGLDAGSTIVNEDETVTKQKKIQARAWESK